jgi:hypothetical protein
MTFRRTKTIIEAINFQTRIERWLLTVGFCGELTQLFAVLSVLARATRQRITGQMQTSKLARPRAKDN